MSGFGEFIKNERRNKTLDFFARIFKSLDNIGIFFWLMLIGTVCFSYKVCMYEDKFPLVCGNITNMEMKKDDNGTTSTKEDDYDVPYIEINTGKTLNEFKVSQTVYDKYYKQYSTNTEVKFCESVISSEYVFFLCLLGLLWIITIVSFIKWVE